MKNWPRYTLLLLAVIFAMTTIAAAQEPVDEPAQTGDRNVVTQNGTAADNSVPVTARQTNFRKNIFRDQKAIWKSPFALKRSQLKWAIPAAAAIAVLVATDRRTSSWISNNGTLQPMSKGIGLTAVSVGGVAFGSYLIGRSTKNDRLRETGILSVQALIDTGIVIGATKFVAHRARPNMDSGRGRFFTHGSSFPSGHSAYTWTVATVVAHEYDDKPIVKYGAYAFATVIAASRYTGRAHFLSEVIVGSAIGFGIGHFVFKKHHTVASGPAAADGGSEETVSKVPFISPYFDPKTATYGGRVTWKF